MKESAKGRFFEKIVSELKPFPATRGVLAQKMITMVSSITLLQQMGIIPSMDTCRKCKDNLGKEFKTSTRDQRYWTLVGQSLCLQNIHTSAHSFGKFKPQA